MIISDLNHLETIAEDPKVVGGSGSYLPYYKFFGLNKFINVGIDIEENVATVRGEAIATGDETLTDVSGATITTDHGSQSSLSTISVSSSKKKYYY